MPIGKATQGEESTAPSFQYCYFNMWRVASPRDLVCTSPLWSTHVSFPPVGMYPYADLGWSVSFILSKLTTANIRALLNSYSSSHVRTDTFVYVIARQGFHEIAVSANICTNEIYVLVLCCGQNVTLQCRLKRRYLFTCTVLHTGRCHLA
jgi:hypothetical protein